MNKMINKKEATHSELIVAFLFEAGRGRPVRMPFEEIVVGLFKKYPETFHLKGYPEYPDAGASIHKRLYDLKKHGYVIAHNMVFSLTERGLDFARSGQSGSKASVTAYKLSRSAKSELERIRGLEGFRLFVHGRTDELSQNDLYSYLGVTVRTPKNAFRGRMETVSVAIEELRKNPEGKEDVIAYHDMLLARNDVLIDYFSHE